MKFLFRQYEAEKVFHLVVTRLVWWLCTCACAVLAACYLLFGHHPEHILSQTPRGTLSKVIYLLGALVSLAYEALYYVSSDHF